MPLFWRGAPHGSYWHLHDARATGFTPRFPNMLPTVDRMVQHIAMGTVASPFVSLTRSFAVAWSYAVVLSGLQASSSNPAFVYEVEIDDPLPPGLQLVDPVYEIASAGANPLGRVPYAHDGLPSLLLGVVDSRMKRHLNRHPPRPQGAPPRGANVTDELITMVRALRDAEVLAVGTIPASLVKFRHDVW